MPRRKWVLFLRRIRRSFALVVLFAVGGVSNPLWAGPTDDQMRKIQEIHNAYLAAIQDPARDTAQTRAEFARLIHMADRALTEAKGEGWRYSYSGYSPRNDEERELLKIFSRYEGIDYFYRVKDLIQNPPGGQDWGMAARAAQRKKEADFAELRKISEALSAFEREILSSVSLKAKASALAPEPLVTDAKKAVQEEPPAKDPNAPKDETNGANLVRLVDGKWVAATADNTTVEEMRNLIERKLRKVDAAMRLATREGKAASFAPLLPQIQALRENRAGLLGDALGRTFQRMVDGPSNLWKKLWQDTQRFAAGARQQLADQRAKWNLMLERMKAEEERLNRIEREQREREASRTYYHPYPTRRAEQCETKFPKLLAGGAVLAVAAVGYETYNAFQDKSEWAPEKGYEHNAEKYEQMRVALHTLEGHGYRGLVGKPSHAARVAAAQTLSNLWAGAPQTQGNTENELRNAVHGILKDRPAADLGIELVKLYQQLSPSSQWALEEVAKDGGQVMAVRLAALEALSPSYRSGNGEKAEEIFPAFRDDWYSPEVLRALARFYSRMGLRHEDEPSKERRRFEDMLQRRLLGSSAVVEAAELAYGSYPPEAVAKLAYEQMLAVKSNEPRSAFGETTLWQPEVQEQVRLANEAGTLPAHLYESIGRTVGKGRSALLKELFKVKRPDIFPAVAKAAAVQQRADKAFADEMTQALIRRYARDFQTLPEAEMKALREAIDAPVFGGGPGKAIRDHLDALEKSREVRKEELNSILSKGVMQLGEDRTREFGDKFLQVWKPWDSTMRDAPWRQAHHYGFSMGTLLSNLHSLRDSGLLPSLTVSDADRKTLEALTAEKVPVRKFIEVLTPRESEALAFFVEDGRDGAKTLRIALRNSYSGVRSVAFEVTAPSEALSVFKGEVKDKDAFFKAIEGLEIPLPKP